MLFPTTAPAASGGCSAEGLPQPSFNCAASGCFLRRSSNTNSSANLTNPIISSFTTEYIFPTTFTATKTVYPTAIPVASSDHLPLGSNGSLSRTDIISALVLGGVAVLLLIIITFLFCLFIRYRRQERGTNSPPFTSLAAPSPRSPNLPRNTAQSAPHVPLEDFRGTSLSMGPQRTIDPVPTSAFHPRIRHSRSISAPGVAPRVATKTPPPILVPPISIQPNTPSVRSPNASGETTPIPQPGPAVPTRTSSFRAGTGGQRLTSPTSPRSTGRLGVPAFSEAQRGSAGTIGSHVGFEYEAEIARAEERRRVRGVLPESRASSGVFPE